jgi:hypothetical protein
VAQALRNPGAIGDTGNTFELARHPWRFAMTLALRATDAFDYAPHLWLATQLPLDGRP